MTVRVAALSTLYLAPVTHTETQPEPESQPESQPEPESEPAPESETETAPVRDGGTDGNA